MLYTKICDSTITQTEQEEYLGNKNTLEDLYRYKEQGAYICSRADFIEKNEKSNKYFYNKEKSFFEKKTVNSLTVSNKLVDKPNEILAELKQFYTNLYSSSHPDTECADFQALLNTENLLVLPETDKQCCEGDVTIEECKRCIRSHANR